MAQTDGERKYTDENPLVYEDSWDLWPYSFLNENGAPRGFNIDLINMLMDELHIPYVVILKPQQEALQDLKDGKSDLMLGLAAGFHDEYGQYGRHSITLFTQSVVTPKSRSVAIKTFRDLSKPGQKVIVNDSSLCHHLMLDYGWTDNIVVTNDIKASILQVNADKEGQIVWNTLSLKWLINNYQLDNVELTPVNMPHGDYKFMSNDRELLDRLDAAYARLYAADKLTPLENNWFYPDRKQTEVPEWEWWLTALALLLLAIAAVYIVSYLLQNRRVTKANDRLNRRLALIIETSKVRIWTYDVITHEFAWRDEHGQVDRTYTMEQFAQRYSEEDFRLLKEALDRIASQHKDANGHEEDDLTLELKARDVEGGDRELHDFVVVLSVLQRDKYGHPSVIIGTKKDVTVKRLMKRLEDERTLRYWSIFYSDDAAILYFDKDGIIQNANAKAGEIYHSGIDELIGKRVHLNDLFCTKFTDMYDTDKFHGIYAVGDSRVEYQMSTVCNDEGKLLGIFAFCRQLLTILVLLAITLNAAAQALSDRYNGQRPVVIVCDKDNAPYQFQNNIGKASGSDVDVVNAVMKELGLPFTYVIKEKDAALKTFISGDADLILTADHSVASVAVFVSENIIDYCRIREDSIAEIHFVSKDRQLVEQIDDQYSRMKQRGDIVAIQDRWLHPDRAEAETSPAVLYIIAGALLLAVVLWLFSRLAKRHVKRVTRNSTELNEMMYKALHMGNFDVMQYDIANDLITNQYGNILPDKGLTLAEYTQRIHPDQREEFIQKSKRLNEGAIRHFELNKRWNQGTEEEPHYLNFQGHAICEVDEDGRPAYIVNALYDVTHDVEEVHAAHDLGHQYEAILNNPFVAMSFYDNKGHLIVHNEAMKRMLAGFDDSLFKEVINPEERSDVRCTRHLYYPEFGIDKYVECHIQPLYNAKGEIANYLVTTNELTKTT